MPPLPQIDTSLASQDDRHARSPRGGAPVTIRCKNPGVNNIRSKRTDGLLETLVGERIQLPFFIAMHDRKTCIQKRGFKRSSALRRTTQTSKRSRGKPVASKLSCFSAPPRSMVGMTNINRVFKIRIPGRRFEGSFSRGPAQAQCDRYFFRR